MLLYFIAPSSQLKLPELNQCNQLSPASSQQHAGQPITSNHQKETQLVPSLQQPQPGNTNNSYVACKYISKTYSLKPSLIIAQPLAS